MTGTIVGIVVLSQKPRPLAMARTGDASGFAARSAAPLLAEQDGIVTKWH